MRFRLAPKSVTLNDLERRNGVILRYFSEFGSFRGALRKSSRSLSNLLMSSCLLVPRLPSLPATHHHTLGRYKLSILLGEQRRMCANDCCEQWKD